MGLVLRSTDAGRSATSISGRGGRPKEATAAFGWRSLTGIRG